MSSPEPPPIATNLITACITHIRELSKSSGEVPDRDHYRATLCREFQRFRLWTHGFDNTSPTEGTSLDEVLVRTRYLQEPTILLLASFASCLLDRRLRKVGNNHTCTLLRQSLSNVTSAYPHFSRALQRKWKTPDAAIGELRECNDVLFDLLSTLDNVMDVMKEERDVLAVANLVSKPFTDSEDIPLTGDKAPAGSRSLAMEASSGTCNSRDFIISEGRKEQDRLEMATREKQPARPASGMGNHWEIYQQYICDSFPQMIGKLDIERFAQGNVDCDDRLLKSCEDKGKEKKEAGEEQLMMSETPGDSVQLPPVLEESAMHVQTSAGATFEDSELESSAIHSLTADELRRQTQIMTAFMFITVVSLPLWFFSTYFVLSENGERASSWSIVDASTAIIIVVMVSLLCAQNGMIKKWLKVSWSWMFSWNTGQSDQQAPKSETTSGQTGKQALERMKSLPSAGVATTFEDSGLESSTLHSLEAEIRQQGKTISAFTIITTLFLPLGFISSYFALSENRERAGFRPILAPSTASISTVIMIVVIGSLLYALSGMIKKWLKVSWSWMSSWNTGQSDQQAPKSETTSDQTGQQALERTKYLPSAGATTFERFWLERSALNGLTAVSTQRQLETVSVLTFVAAVFLPLVFLSSFLAVPENREWGRLCYVGGPVTAIIIVVMALFLRGPDDKIKEKLTMLWPWMFSGNTDPADQQAPKSDRTQHLETSQSLETPQSPRSMRQWLLPRNQEKTRDSIFKV